MNTFKNKYAVIFIGLILLLLLSASGIQDRLTGNWTYQEFPVLPNVQLKDVVFLDSLTGFSVLCTGANPVDSAYIMKTTNGGNNWFRSKVEKANYYKVQFINSQIGYVCGQIASNAIIYKTTNQGNLWFNIPVPLLIELEDMHVLNEDTIWFVDRFGLEGGIFRTTNGGLNWQRQAGGGTSNADRIFMFNKDFGFSSDGTFTSRTTNSGMTWQSVPGGSFTDIKFFDTLIGYKCYGDFKKTTDGGLSWVTLPLPSVPSPGLSTMHGFQFINADTLWGVGGDILLGNQFRGILYNSTNGGQTIRYQIPDTSINKIFYDYVRFINSKTGWVYAYNGKGLHTVFGGDTLFIINAVNNYQSYLFPEDYVLFQNYPNPFNPFTTIKFGVKRSSDITLEVFDIRGKRIKTIIDGKRLNSGIYEYGFDGSGLSSGIFFYRLVINSKQSITKKMILVK